MKKLQLPSSYAALSPEEQCAAFGGSEFGDAVGSFFDNLHFNDFFWIGRLLGITREATVTAVQYLDNTQQRNDQPVENSLPQLFSLQ